MLSVRLRSSGVVCIGVFEYVGMLHALAGVHAGRAISLARPWACNTFDIVLMTSAQYLQPGILSAALHVALPLMHTTAMWEPSLANMLLRSATVNPTAVYHPLRWNEIRFLLGKDKSE